MAKTPIRAPKAALAAVAKSRKLPTKCYDNWEALYTLIREHVDAQVADSWKGGTGDPDDMDIIETEARLAQLKLSVHIERHAQGIFRETAAMSIKASGDKTGKTDTRTLKEALAAAREPKCPLKVGDKVRLSRQGYKTLFGNAAKTAMQLGNLETTITWLDISAMTWPEPLWRVAVANKVIDQYMLTNEDFEKIPATVIRLGAPT